MSAGACHRQSARLEDGCAMVNRRGWLVVAVWAPFLVLLYIAPAKAADRHPSQSALTHAPISVQPLPCSRLLKRL